LEKTNASLQASGRENGIEVATACTFACRARLAALMIAAEAFAAAYFDYIFNSMKKYSYLSVLQP
jgi:hypothetical protein